MKDPWPFVALVAAGLILLGSFALAVAIRALPLAVALLLTILVARWLW